MIIYKIENKENGMIYIGQTVRTLRERTLEHARNKETYIDRTMNKYGIEHFDISVIDTAETMDELNEKEIYWIKHYNSMKPNGYNLCYGGNNTKGFHHSEESKAKMSKIQKERGNQVGEKNHFYGKHHSKEQKEKWSKERKGVKMTEEFKHKARYNKVNSKRVINIETGEIFVTIAEAARIYNIKSEHISRVCRGQRKTTGGYHWKYADEKAE